MHNLIHLVDDTEYMSCPILDITAYPFENALRKIKNMLRNGNKALPQLCRRLNESCSIDNEKVCIPPKIKIMKQLREDQYGEIIIKKITYKEAIFTSKSPDDIGLLTNDTILQINEIFTCPNIYYLQISGKSLKKRHLFSLIHSCLKI